MADVVEEEPEWLAYPYIPRGALTLLDGDPGVGKSSILAALAAAASCGGKFLGQLLASGKVLLLATEDSVRKVLKRRLRLANANMTNILALDETFNAETLTLNPKGVEWLRSLIAEHRPVLVIIDTLVNFTEGKTDTNRANQVREMIRPLARLAEEFNCAIIGVRHLRKEKGGPAIYQGQGSMDFVGAARSVVMAIKAQVWTRRGPEEQRYFAHAKHNWGPLGRTWKYDIVDGVVKWGTEPEDYSLTADNLCRGGQDNSMGPRAIAKAIILQMVTEATSVRSSVLEAAMEEHDIKPITYKRARGELVAEEKVEVHFRKKAWWVDLVEAG